MSLGRSWPVSCWLLLLAGGAHAFPDQVVHEGLVLDEDGLPMEGHVSMRFTLYDAPEDGAELWSEEHELGLLGGYYRLALGDKQVLADVFTGQPTYLGISVDGAPDLLPRHPMGAVPHAFVANNAVGDITPRSITVAGRTLVDADGDLSGVLAGIKDLDGAGSGLDADRLDGIDSSHLLNLADPDAPELLLAMLAGVGGAGSGLNADVLDGLESSRYMRADQDTGTSGSLAVGGELQVIGATGFIGPLSTGEVRVAPGASLGVGVDEPQAALHVDGNVIADQVLTTFVGQAAGDDDVVMSATGGSVSTHAGHRFHVFASSGRLSVDVGGPAEVLVVAGGGGAGGCNGGGGGAGGLIHRDDVTLRSDTTYVVTVGAGGAGNAGRTLGASGANSSFVGEGYELVAIGGGGGSDDYAHKDGLAGGSGGGAFDPPGRGGAGTQGQGYPGGVGVLGNNPGPDGGTYRMGGGGGAAEAGNTDGHGRGGDGLFFDQLAAVGGDPAGWFAGGGSGGCHGTQPTPRADGGGGVGGTCGGDRDAIANTGGGGGGAVCGVCDPGGNGASGVVIVRYSDGAAGGISIKRGNVGIGTMEPGARLQVNGGIQLGDDTRDCAAALAGTLRWHDATLEVCNGTKWASIGGAPSRDGSSRQRAAASCQAILDDGAGHGDGLYWIDPSLGDGSDAFQVYCLMSADGGGWALVVYIDGNDMDHASAGQVGSMPITPSTSTTSKLSDEAINALLDPSMGEASVRFICAGTKQFFKGCGHSSVDSATDDRLGRSCWYSYSDPAATQPYGTNACNWGSGTYGSHCGASDVATYCSHCDGTYGAYCGGYQHFGDDCQHFRNGCGQDGGIGYSNAGQVWVRTSSGQIDEDAMDGRSRERAGASCKAILDEGLERGDRLYWIDPNLGNTNDAFQAYCLMSADGGGWALVVAIDGNDMNHANAAQVGEAPITPSTGTTSKLSDEAINLLLTEGSPSASVRFVCGSTKQFFKGCSHNSIDSATDDRLGRNCWYSYSDEAATQPYGTNACNWGSGTYGSHCGGSDVATYCSHCDGTYGAYCGGYRHFGDDCHHFRNGCGQDGGIGYSNAGQVWVR